MHRSPIVLVLPLCALVIAPPAAAAGTEGKTLFGNPVNQPPELTEEELAARRAAFEKHLQDNDLIHSGGLVIPRAQAEGTGAWSAGSRPSFAWDKPSHRQTIFLNFFGGQMKGGTNASEMESPCIQGKTVDYPGYNRTEQEALAIIQVFVNAVEPFGVRIAYDAYPPKHLPYSMVMMGGKPGVIGLPNGVLGVSCNLDCGETWWRDTTFAFTEQSGDVQTLGTTALQEAAHAWGLDHISGENNIMYPFATPGAKVWADTCTPYDDATGAIGCEFIHDEFCGPQAGKQNDVAELTAFFGPNSVDDVPPTVKLLQPLDGAIIDPGTSVTVEAEVSDNFEGYGWRLMIPEVNQELPAYFGETSWSITPPKGVYTVRVEAVDHDRNIGFAEAKIYVGVEPPPDTTGEMSSGGEQPTTSDSATGGETGGVTEASASDTSPIDGDDKGCNCATGPVPQDMPLWLLALAGAGFVRRRRR